MTETEKVAIETTKSHPVLVVSSEENKNRDKFDAYIIAKLKGCKVKKRAAVFSHPQIDIDAIGAQLGLHHLLETKYDIETDLYIDGDISHPQNKIAVQLLDPNLIPVAKYKPDNYFLNILVDTIPSNAGTGGNEIKFDIVVDHHKEIPDDSDGCLAIHEFSGSCCGIVWEIMDGLGVELNPENEVHAQIGLGLWAGVVCDTQSCSKLDTCDRDFKTQRDMFHIASAESMRKISRYKIPLSWAKILGRAINDHIIHDGIVVAGLGLLEEDQYHAIAMVADTMLGWNNIHTAVAFALVERKYISGV